MLGFFSHTNEQLYVLKHMWLIETNMYIDMDFIGIYSPPLCMGNPIKTLWICCPQIHLYYLVFQSFHFERTG